MGHRCRFAGRQPDSRWGWRGARGYWPLTEPERAAAR
jgi:hypothetical protein